MNRCKSSVGNIARGFLHLGLMPIRKMTVDHQDWLPQENFLNGLALCQLPPEVTVVQLGTYIGYRLRRVAGGLILIQGGT